MGSITIDPAVPGLTNPLKGPALDGIAAKPGAEGATPLDAFSKLLEGQIEGVDASMKAADASSEAFLRGEETSIHEVMIAMSKADVSFRLMTQVGRKVVEAYQEIMRMQV